MTTKQLGSILKKMYYSPEAKKVTMILLFGVKYADDILCAAQGSSQNVVVKEIIKHAGIPESYATEIKKAVALSVYVEVKPTVTI